MGDNAQHFEFNILLPKADVHFHTEDESITDAVNQLKADWRYKRIDIVHQKGKLANAIDYYTEYQSPSLLIVETDSIDDGFMEQLDALAVNLDEGTSAIIIGPVNDVYVYRKLVGMGVSDYLVRPVDKNVLSDVIARTLVDKIGVTNSRLITVSGAKGGAGASSIAQLIAHTLSSNGNQKTMLMDAAGGWSYTSVAMGHETAATLQEAARMAEANNEEDLNRIQVNINDNLTLLACGGDGLYDDPISADSFEKIIDNMMAHYPYLVLDLSCAPAHIARIALKRANKMFVVSTPTLPSLRAARTLLKESEDLRGGDGEGESIFIVNQQGLDKASEVNNSDIEAALETNIDLTIAYDPKIFHAAESEGQSLGQIKGSEKLTNSLLSLMQDILDKDDKSGAVASKAETSLVGGLLNKIKKG